VEFLVPILLVIIVALAVAFVLANKRAKINREMHRSATPDSSFDRRDGGTPQSTADDDGDTQEYPYQLKATVVSEGERSFFGVLLRALDGADVHVFAKIRLSDFVTVTRGTAKSLSFQNRINQKHLDFLICDRQRLAPLLAIELDDSSHARADRQERDAFVENACAAAGLPLLRVAARRSYVVADLDAQIREKLGRSELVLPARRITFPRQDKDTTTEPGLVVGNATNGLAVATATSPTRCPRCDSALVERRGPRNGSRFLSCSNYPDCRHIQPFDKGVVP
jgi:hypothetical protein